MRVVSFASDLPDVSYTRHLMQMEQQLNAWGLRTYCQYSAPGENWILACQRKPSFLKSCLEKFEENILWLDADTQVTMINEKALADISTPFAATRCFQQHEKGNFFIRIGAIWCRYSPTTLELLDQIIEQVDQGFSDHKAIINVLATQKDKVTYLTDKHIVYKDGFSRSRSKTQCTRLLRQRGLG